MLKIYEYSGCSTCKKALNFLDQKKIEYKKIAIVDQPPTLSELKKMLRFYDGQIGKLFNTSGLVYREMKLGENLKTMTEAQALGLLAKNGKLIKRPFALDETSGRVGFKEEEWKEMLIGR